MDWFRMYGEFATDPKVQMLSEAMQRRLVMLFCLECSNGIETFHVTERETSIAFALRVSEADLAETKALFMRKNFINEDWTLCNWSKRQYVSDSSTARVRAHREKKKKESVGDETGAKRSSNAPEQNRTEQIPPPIPREADFDGRTKFAMTQDWEPNQKSFPAVLAQNALVGHSFDQDLFLEFRSFWLASPDDHRTQAKWEHALAQHLKRNLRTQQANGRAPHGNDRPGSAQAKTHSAATHGSRPARQGARSVVDQARERLDAREAARQAAGEAVVQDD